MYIKSNERLMKLAKKLAKANSCTLGLAEEQEIRNICDRLAAFLGAATIVEKESDRAHQHEEINLDLPERFSYYYKSKLPVFRVRFSGQDVILRLSAAPDRILQDLVNEYDERWLDLEKAAKIMMMEMNDKSFLEDDLKDEYKDFFSKGHIKPHLNNGTLGLWQKDILIFRIKTKGNEEEIKKEVDNIKSYIDLRNSYPNLKFRRG